MKPQKITSAEKGVHINLNNDPLDNAKDIHTASMPTLFTHKKILLFNFFIILLIFIFVFTLCLNSGITGLFVSNTPVSKIINMSFNSNSSLLLSLSEEPIQITLNGSHNGSASITINDQLFYTAIGSGSFTHTANVSSSGTNLTIDVIVLNGTISLDDLNYFIQQADKPEVVPFP